MKEALTIGYFADGPWSHKTFELLIADETLKIEFIVPRSDTSDTVLRDYAEKYNIPYLYPVSINTDDFFERVITYDCDLFVSMSFNQIFKQRLINLPPLKTINCHAGLLPFYRGRNILNWALINDESEYGITVHYIDEGIDTGDIILQRRYQITDDDSYRTLLNRAHDDCADILYDAIKIIQKGKTRPIRQDSIHPVGFYCGKRNIGDEIIDWNQDSRDIFNFIRAVNSPGPIATTFLNGQEVKINTARFLKDAPSYKAVVGQILLKTENGYLVKTKDSFIEILDITTETKIKVGDRFKQ